MRGISLILVLSLLFMYLYVILVFITSWRRYDNSQRSTEEEIRCLTSMTPMPRKMFTRNSSS